MTEQTQEPLTSSESGQSQSEPQPNGSATTRPGSDGETVGYQVFLVMEGEVGGVAWQPVGVLTVPARVQRKTVLKTLLDGQVSNEGDESGGSVNGVPQIPMDAGEHGVIHLVPVGELGEPIVIGASSRIVFEVQA